MRIIILDNDTEETYTMIEDATASQIAAYTTADVIKAEGHELIVDTVIVDDKSQEVIIFVK